MTTIEGGTHMWILTATGKRFSLVDPKPEMVSLRDIALHLSRLNRFTGATTLHWSVAEHSILVAMLLRKWGESATVQYAGLLHDAAEAYIGDVSSPLKLAMRALVCCSGESPYDLIEGRVSHAVSSALSLPVPFPHEMVKKADLTALPMEERDVMPKPKGIDDRTRMPPDDESVYRFLSMARRFTGWFYTEDVFIHLAKRLRNEMVEESRIFVATPGGSAMPIHQTKPAA